MQNGLYLFLCLIFVKFSVTFVRFVSSSVDKLEYNDFDFDFNFGFFLNGFFLLPGTGETLVKMMFVIKW